MEDPEGFYTYEGERELTLKKLISQVSTLLMPFYIHHPTLDRIILHDLGRPFAELHRALILDLKPNSNDGLKIIVIYSPSHLALAFSLNY